MTINHEILFRRKSAVVVPGNYIGIPAHRQYLATFIAELANLGFRATDELLAAVSLRATSARSMKAILGLARESVKGHKEYKPMYPNFPGQVIDASQAELWINAMFHYMGDAIGLRILPNYVVKDREAMARVDFDSLKVISLANSNDFADVFVNLLGMKTSWSAVDQADVQWFIDHDYTITMAIPNKENLAFLATRVDLDKLIPFAQHATDVLRMVVVASGGDSALDGVGTAKVKIVSLPKRVRRAMADRLETFSNLEEDMVRNIALWKLVLHSMHVGDYAKDHPRLARAAVVVRNNGKGANTFNSRVENGIAGGNTGFVVRNLKARPGEFARRLDKVLRDSSDPASVVREFGEVASQVSTPVLWGLESFYTNRHLYSGNNAAIDRSFSVKGRRATVQTAKANLKEISPIVSAAVTSSVYNALTEVYRERGLVDGTFFVDDSVNGLTIPFGTRSASKSDVVVGRGSRVPLTGDSDTVRMFIWWKDISTDRSSYWGSGRVDLDLSALAISEDFTKTQDIGYYNLRGNGITHSGDITSAPNGAAEFIDVNVDTVLASGYRYVTMTVNSFSGHSYANIPEVYAGAMDRTGAQKGEIYDPSTVSSAFDVTSDSRMVTPLVFDLKTREIVWLDMSVGVRSDYGSNLRGHISPTINTVRGYVVKDHSKIRDLIFLHAAANGAKVVAREDADHVFDVHRGRLRHNGEVISHDDLMANWV